jgi:hypothetical protein
MNDDLLDQLAAYGRFHRLHQNSVTVAEVAEPSTGLPLDAEPRRPRRPGRWLIAAAAVIALVLLVAVAVLVADIGHNAIRTKPAARVPAPTTLPAVLGWEGLVTPEGATPSTPETGELVAAMWSHASAGGDLVLWVYADGRVIWSRYPTGWHEQRLTPEGVALVRAEILSTGLFDPDQPPPGSELGLDFPFYGDIEVRNQDRLVYVPRRPDQAWTNEFDRLHERLRTLDSWLPPNAWQDPTIRTYVPSAYAICLSSNRDRFENQPPIEPSSILSLLPAPAKDLLGGARHWRWHDLASEDPGTTKRMGPTPIAGQGNPHCFDVTPDQARVINQALDDAGIDHDAFGGDLIFRFDAPDPVSRTVGAILFLPYLPHGVPALTGG